MTLTTIKKAGLDELALDHVFTIGASGTDHYTFQGEGLNGTVNDPTLYLVRGKTYRFENGTGAHPIRIQSTSGASGTAYNTGVTNNAGSGTVIVEVQHDSPDVLYYQCTSHANMGGILYTVGALADGGVTTAKLATDAVTTAKVAAGNITATELASDSVTGAKIAAGAINNANKIQDSIITGAKVGSGTIAAGNIATNAVTTAKIADDAVTSAKVADNAVARPSIQDNAINADKIADSSVNTAKILDEAVTLAKLPHGTSSNDGKFLRANNGADPTFETVSGTTINNNADNRVITGSGTANTLNAESYWTVSGASLALGQTSPSANIHLSNSYVSFRMDSDGSNNHTTFSQVTGTGKENRFYFGDAADNDVGQIVYDHNGDHMKFITGTTERMRLNEHGLCLGGTGASNGLDDYEEGTWTPILDRASGNIGGTLHSSVGMYVKVGKLVYVTFNIYRTSASGGSSYYQLAGLPFGMDTTNQGSWAMSAHMTRSHWDGDNTGSTNRQISFKFLGGGNTYGYSANIDTNGWYTSHTNVIVATGQMTYIAT